MKTIIVNTVKKDENVIHGLIVEHNLVMDNLRVIFGDDKAFKIITHFNNQINGAHSIFRFCQFVIYLELRPNIGYSMKISDFRGNIDNALDEYLKLEAKGWQNEDKISYIEIVNEIISEPKETAQMKSLDGFLYIQSNSDNHQNL
jgi:hypothetical protein